MEENFILKAKFEDLLKIWQICLALHMLEFNVLTTTSPTSYG